jgi:hypothetical protein
MKRDPSLTQSAFYDNGVDVDSKNNAAKQRGVAVAVGV